MARFKKKNEEGKLVPISHSPIPVKKVQDELSFPDAIREVINGRKITRLGWNNDHYCFLNDGFLSIYRDGKNHQWLVNDGDMLGIDWIVLSEAN